MSAKSKDDASGAVPKALRVLEVVAARRRPLSIAEIAAALDMPQPTAHRIVGTLERLGFVGRELGPKGIRINAISPAVVDTAMTHEMLATGLGQKAIARIPLGRLAERSDVAKAALFLASEDAAFITGETIAVDGGFLRT